MVHGQKNIKFGKKEKVFVPASSRTPDRPVRSVGAVPTTLLSLVVIFLKETKS